MSHALAERVEGRPAAEAPSRLSAAFLPHDMIARHALSMLDTAGLQSLLASAKQIFRTIESERDALQWVCE